MKIALKRSLSSFSAAVLAVLLASWLSRESIPVEFSGIYFSGIPDPIHSLPDQIIPLKQKFVPRGGTAVFRMVGEKYRNCPAIVSEEIIDAEGSVHRLPARVGSVTETGPFDTYITVPVPSEASEGRATFRQRASYGIDPLSGCFRPYIVGPPDRPTARFWIGTSAPKSWAEADSDRSPR